MLKNLLDACVGALGFWAVGYGLSYGNKDGGETITFVGDTYVSEGVSEGGREGGRERARVAFQSMGIGDNIWRQRRSAHFRAPLLASLP